jgi:hypothetical protein
VLKARLSDLTFGGGMQVLSIYVLETMLGQAARPSSRYGRLGMTSLLVCLLASLMLPVVSVSPA